MSEYKQGRFGAITFPKNLPLQAEKDNMEDIERLLYTAATRAEDSLILTYSEKNIQDKTLEPLPSIISSVEEFESIEDLEPSLLSKNLELEQDILVSLPYL